MSRVNYVEPATRQECWQPKDEGGDGDALVKLPHTVSFVGRGSTVSFETERRVSRAPDPVGKTDDDGPESMSGSSLSQETDATSASSAQRASREAGLTIFRLCGHRIAVPFTTWTFLAMSVPIIFLVIVVTRPLAQATALLGTIEELAPIVPFSSTCVSALSRERLSVVLFLRGNANLDQLNHERSTTDAACAVEWVEVLQRLAAQDEYFITSFRQAGLHGNRVAAVRQQVDDWILQQNASWNSADVSSFLENVADVYGGACKASSETVALAADKIEAYDTRSFLGYKLISDLRVATYAFVGEACALEVRTSNESTTSPHRLLAAQEALTTARDNVRALTRTFVRRDLEAWWSCDAMTALHTAVEPALRGIGLRLTYDQVQELTVNAISLLLQIEKKQIKRAADAIETNALVLDNALLAGFSIFACLVAAGLLAWQQLRVQAQLETQVASVERTRRAVSAFVPRFFLAKMGYTSITQVRVGESTNVALAMLFADVRRFTTVSEGMSCEALFDWVQEYFRRMTLVVDSRNGNINQFIGDGLFAVFSSARDSVRCAIDMQSDVQQLNVQRLCEQGNHVPIEIGVGLHHDVLAMGILGDERRHTCTAISASVNLASRLDGLTKQLGCRILASQAVIDQLAPLDLEAVHHRRVGSVRVKGSALNTVVYDIFQSDERAMQNYKRETKAAFEDFAMQVLVVEDAAVVDATANRLRAAAEALEVSDRAVDEMLRSRDVAASAFVFDLK
jgi:class 3 adenylate cyclase